MADEWALERRPSRRSRAKLRRTSSSGARVGVPGSEDADVTALERLSKLLSEDAVAERRAPRRASGVAGKRGTSGLFNLGNTCFLNVICQALRHCRYLRQLCDEDASFTDMICPTSPLRGKLASAFAKLVRRLWSESGGRALSPARLRKLLARWAPRFAGYMQQDCHEFLRFLLDGLHEETRRAEGGEDERGATVGAVEGERAWARDLSQQGSAVYDLFCGQLRSSRRCLVCGHERASFEPFLDLSLPLRLDEPSSAADGADGVGDGVSDGKDGADGDEQSLLDCLRAFSAPEKMEGDCKLDCDRCGKRCETEMRLQPWRLPKVLILHLKRFKMDLFSDVSLLKLETAVRLQQQLKASDLLPESAPASEAGEGKRGEGEEVVYALRAVVKHEGGLGGGHYTVDCFNDDDSCWYHYNDSVARRVDGPQLRGSEPYLLMYERV